MVKMWKKPEKMDLTELFAFDEFDKKYKSEKLFPVFASRLPDKKRRGISDILKNII